jgi:uncharacterized protein YuzE
MTIIALRGNGIIAKPGSSVIGRHEGLDVRLSYDKSTDSLYSELRPLPSKRTREIAEGVMLDLGENGEPVGCDLQHASAKCDLIMSIILGDEPRAAAE